MQDVNENMDELFRRAAENYPLDTSSKDWFKVQLALQNEQGVTQAVKKDSKGRFLWLLLLLPLGFVCNRYLSNDDSVKETNGSKEYVTVNKNLSNEKDLNKNNSTRTSESIDQTLTQNSNTAPSEISTSQSQSEKSVYSPGTSILQNSGPGRKTNKTVKYNSRNQIERNQGLTQIHNDLLNTPGVAISGQNQNSLSNNSNDLLLKTIPGRDPYQLSVEPLDAMNKNLVQPEVKTKTDNKKEKKFYAGLMGGADITTIKFQKIENAGYAYGLLLGYELSKKWSVETGVYKDKKFYYTDGEYFNTSSLWMPPNSKVTAVTGYCEMIEIPLTFRYTIASSAKRSWFVSGGATSYVMQKEDYDYTYYYGNSNSYATHNRKYDSDSKQLFAAAHISGGYARKLNKTTDLRIEPYIKLPLAGMGVGELKFISTGIHLGITRKLF
jgi:hypothetical protein